MINNNCPYNVAPIWTKIPCQHRLLCLIEDIKLCGKAIDFSIFQRYRLSKLVEEEIITIETFNKILNIKE